MKKSILIAIGALFLIAAVLIFRPVPIVKEENALVVKGKVDSLYEGGVKDLVISLKGDKRIYYINRGLENGLSVNDLNSKILHKEVTLKYPKYWTPLDWNDNIKHISKLEFGNEVIFNELK